MFLVTQRVSQRLTDTSDMEISAQRHVEALIPHQNPHGRGKWTLFCFHVCLSLTSSRCDRASLRVWGVKCEIRVGDWEPTPSFRQLCDILEEGVSLVWVDVMLSCHLLSCEARGNAGGHVFTSASSNPKTHCTLLVFTVLLVH